jgi:septum formation protein
VLASASPRRRDLLEAAGYRFRLCPVEVVELSVHDRGHETTKPVRVVEENARRKAIAAQASIQGDPSNEATRVRESPEPATTYVLAADTVLILEDGWVGKPGNREQAVALLKRLAGRAHEVATGVVLLGPGVALSFVEVTRVFLKPLTVKEIRAYHRAVDPLDKAGGYDINQPGPIPGGVVASIEGSYSNVMGLPMERLSPILDRVLAG